MSMSREGRVGQKWVVAVNERCARIENIRSGQVFSTSVYCFPVGYRVGQRWTDGVTDRTGEIPQRVRALALSLARDVK